mmetsp:Transcript_2592/g.4063  ORF Transcript_2592/g.4063 Transcript_2592/m.4063 type:complete len:380 (+) Transcript_2592:118-1257(+)
MGCRKDARAVRGQGCRRKRELIFVFIMTMILVLCHVSAFSSSSSSAWQQQGRASKRESMQCWGAASASAANKCVELEHAEYEAMGVPKGNGRELEPVIILHGLLGSKRNFASLGSGLAKQLQKKRKIVALDLRNHGDNNHDWREEMSYSDMASDVLAFMDSQNFNKAVLVGHSMGGKVAKSLALMHPERVAGLVVLDIAPVRYTTEQDESWNAVATIIHAISQVDLSKPGKTRKDVDADLRKTVPDPALRAFVLTNLEQIRGGGGGDDGAQPSLRWKININAIIQQLDTIAGFDVNYNDVTTNVDNDDDDADDKNIPQYQGDTFIIHGGASRFVRHAHMNVIATFFPNHMLTTIRGAGHWVHAEAPDDTLSLLKQYLDR